MTDEEILAYADGAGDGRLAGAADERAAICSWLRRCARENLQLPPEEYAAKIESGEHWHLAENEEAPF